MKNLISLFGILAFGFGCWWAYQGDWQTGTFSVAVAAAVPFLREALPQLAKLANFDLR